MGNKLELTLDERQVFGKKVRHLRQKGIVPVVVYGPGMKPVSGQAPLNVLTKLYGEAGYHTPVHIKVAGKKRLALIKDIERDYVRNEIIHVSFHAVKANEPVVADIPIRLIGEGESPAERAGLIILQAIEQVQVKALPMDLPEVLEISTTHLETTDDKITVADITVPEGVEIVDNDDGREGTADDDQSVMDLVIANVYEPSALQAANDAAGGDAESADAEDVPTDDEAEEGEEAEEAKAE